MGPPVLILHGVGTNRDREAAWACERAGGAPEIVTVSALADGSRTLADYRMLVLPGGFSYGDDLGAGRVLGLLLKTRLGDQIRAHLEARRPVLGICNGFQALVKSGLLPGLPDAQVTLTRNASDRFECRWVTLEPDPSSPCVFTRTLTEPILCPAAHGEGRLACADAATQQRLEDAGLAALRYVPTPERADGYPGNPNGSAGHIAGLCDTTGTILGLMPHPEDHLIPEHHPRYHRGDTGWTGLPLFEGGVRYAGEL